MSGRELGLIIKRLERLEAAVHGGGYSKHVVDFSVNTNPLAPPLSLVQLLKHAVCNLTRYPSYKELGELLAELHDLRPSCFLMGSGATQLIYDVALAFYKPGCAFYVASPTFCEYERAALRLGARTFAVLPQEGIDPLFDGVTEHLKEGDTLFLCNPNNPTGSAFYAKQIVELSQELERKRCNLVVDESYVWFSDRKFESIKNVDSQSRLVVIRSLTKLLGLPGLRAGYVVSNPKIMSKLELAQSPWPVNSLVKPSLEFLIKNPKFVERSRIYVQKERERVVSELKKIGISAHKSETNFYLLNTHVFGLNSKDLCKKLLQKRLAIRDCSSFRGLDASWVRVCVKKRRENDFLVRTLGGFLK